MSKKYLDSKRKDRNAGFSKRGSAAKGTDAAHKLSHRLAHGILSRTRGRGGHGTGKHTSSEAISRALNDPLNIRIKTKHGNRILDERRDRRIDEAHANRTSITQRTTADRAVQAFKGAENSGKVNRALAQVAEELGNITYNDGKPGRPPTIKSMAKKKKPQQQKESKLLDRFRFW
tara:strand:- start:149 stop:673 length:525 start_codon:yes stop_codon:yes gene_type:complete